MVAKLLLVDGHSLAFRAYYAFVKSREGGLRTSTGIPTSVCFGFLNSLLEVMAAEKPEAIALAFDLGGPTFRHEADPAYKANRSETPEDFIPDVENLRQLLEAMALPIYVVAGYEADDILGTLAQQGAEAGYGVRILTGDRDLFQLVDDDRQIQVLYLGSTFGRGRGPAVEAFGPAEVVAKMKVSPTQIVDYKALCGDSSDNIPGVKGIGDKTAVELLQEFGSLEKIYESLETIKPAVRKKLEAGREAAWHSQRLARIVTDVPLVADWADCQLKGLDVERVTPWLERLELKKFLKDLAKLQGAFGGQGIVAESAAPADRVGVATAASTSAAQADTDFFSAEETVNAQAQAIAVPALQPQIIDTPEKLQALIAELEQHTDPNNPVAWDTETTALDPWVAELVGIGCCWGPGLSDLAYIPLGHRLLGSINLDFQPTLVALRPILEGAQYPKVLQNAKFDRLILKHQGSPGIDLQGVVFDTMLASYILNPDDSHKLENIALRHLGFASESYSDLVPKGQTIGDVEVDRVAYYCGLDAYTTYHLRPKLVAALQTLDPRLLTLLQTVELPLEPVLAAMEDTGIRIDTTYLRDFSKTLETDLAALETQAYDQAGTTFNLSSPKQLSELLFETLGLDTKKTRKTKTGYSTDATVLEKLQGDHPLIDTILEHRTLAKLKSTYVDALPSLVRRDTQRVHTDFNQTVTSTGRLSSSNPNLQNIPIRTAFSRQIRKAFIPQPGWLLVAADYSQIELRILAHLSQEPLLLDAYQTGTDVHTLTAQLLLEKDSISSDERRLGKILNFGIIYGMGAQRFAQETGVSKKEAQVFVDRFHDRYPNIFAYLDRMERQAVSQGYVETLLGRRRYFTFTSDSLRALRGQPLDAIDLNQLKSPGVYDAGLLRAAANAPIQGSSADIIKIAMIQLHQLLLPYQSQLLLQVHDELIFEIPPEEWDSLKPQIQATMQTAVALSVPLVVEIHAGANWMEAKG